VVATGCAASSKREPSNYRLLFFSNREWSRLEAVATLAGRSLDELLAEREGMEVVLIREESVGHGRLVLLKTASDLERLTKEASKSARGVRVLIR
jgi:hypothetical protein